MNRRAAAVASDTTPSAAVTRLSSKRATNRFDFEDEARLHALPKRATRYEVYDTVVTGLELRVTETGTKTFRYRRSGYPAVTIGRLGDGKNGTYTYRKARLKVVEYDAQRERGTEPADERREAREAEGLLAETPKDLLERYLAVKRWRKEPLRDDTRGAYRKDLAFVLQEYFELPIARLTPKKFLELHQYSAVKNLRPDKRGVMRMLGSAYRADRAAHALAAMCRRLELPENLARLVYKEDVTTEIVDKDCRIDPPDIPNVSAWLDTVAQADPGSVKSNLAEAMLLALSTGLRSASIRRLEWSMFQPMKRHPGRYWLDIPGRLMKNKQAARLPLASNANAMLIARRARMPKDAKFIFPQQRKDLALSDTTGLNDDIREAWNGELFGLHDMRKLTTYALEFKALASAAIQDMLLGNTPKGTRVRKYLTVHELLDDLYPFADKAEAYSWPKRAKGIKRAK